MEIPCSKQKEALVKILVKTGYVEKIEVKDKQINISLKYNGKIPAMEDVKRISKPGRKVYVDNQHLPRVLNGLGRAIISTPKGLMTDSQARKEKIGGEVICYIW